MSLAEFVNHNSYALAAALVAALVATYALRRRTVRALAGLLVVAVVLVAPPLALHSEQSNLLELDQAVAAGQPSVLWLHSDL